ncbi:MAG: HAMP domain-containing histidine kinase [Oscillospiraceae bacterium]|nr:HAMP domain-containing histidine kinase [Oscillospiraceae bacterium]
MKKLLYSLRAQLTLSILLVLLFTVAIISVAAKSLIDSKFRDYMANQADLRSEHIVTDLSLQYDASKDEWKTDSLHAIGMNLMYEGYILQIYDINGTLLWDAENHDMSECGQIMQEITARMESVKVTGGFTKHEFVIRQNESNVGSVVITYYGPYFLNENDFKFISALDTALLLSGVLAALFAVLAGGLLARRIARPISKTAHIAAQIAGGNYEIRFESSTGTRETEELAEAINHLAGNLKEQESLRKRLTTDIAHELRTPITAVSAHLEAMCEGLWEPTTERLAACYEELKRLSTLVADLESLARVEGESFKLNRQELDLLELAKSVTAGMEAEAKRKGQSLTLTGEAVAVNADADRLRQVITNLISNAVKYTPEGGNIEVAVKACRGRGRLSVKDDGIGMSEAEQGLVFERFYRTDKSRSRKTGGAGIGLTIAKAIVEAHGGSIGVNSEADKGSEFWVEVD